MTVGAASAGAGMSEPAPASVVGTLAAGRRLVVAEYTAAVDAVAAVVAHTVVQHMGREPEEMRSERYVGRREAYKIMIIE